MLSFKYTESFLYCATIIQLQATREEERRDCYPDIPSPSFTVRQFQSSGIREEERTDIIQICIEFFLYCASVIQMHSRQRGGAKRLLSFKYRLVGLVVKASASRAEGPGFESRLRRDFFGVESFQ